jgi:hypothetical protein
MSCCLLLLPAWNKRKKRGQGREAGRIEKRREEKERKRKNNRK